MKKRILFFAVVLLLCAAPAMAQTKNKKRIADKKFWLSAAVMVAASLADIESTAHWVRVCPQCTERNSWLYGKRPTRKRLYLTLMPITAATIGAMWYVKKDAPNWAWVVIPVTHSAAHGIAAGNNWAYKPKVPGTLACPALGAGCNQEGVRP